MRNFLLISILLLALSCTETSSDNGKRLEGISVENPNTNASIIRNPMTEKTEEIDSSSLAIITFSEDRYNFGELDEGGKVEHTYSFTNTGKVSLVINDVRSTCGCTVADWPRVIIPPGKQGEIVVKFDSKNKAGKQSKPITIIANTIPAKTKIYLDGFVVSK